jgi:hypothetical protein
MKLKSFETFSNRLYRSRYHYPYLLVDGIYPPWAVFINTLSAPVTEKHKKFAAYQEGRRKDIERCFGVLQAKWAILHKPCRLWHQYDIELIIKGCVILHNMIIEDEKGLMLEDYLQEEVDLIQQQQQQNANNDGFTLEEFMAMRGYIQNEITHYALKTDLIQHIWNLD